MYSYILITIVIFFFIWLQWLQSGTKFAKMINAFPGPPIIPILGNVLDWESAPDKMFRWPRIYAERYKGTYYLWVGVAGTLNIITPQDAEAVMGNMKHIQKSPLYGFMERWLGTGLLTSTGQKWQSRRKILTPSFHFNILVNFVDIFGDHCEKLVEEIRPGCCKETKTDVVPLMTKSTLKIICETAMGTNLDVTGIDSNYVDSIYNLAKFILLRIRQPWYFYDFIYNLSWPAYKERRYVKILHDFTKRVIKEREANFKASDLENESEFKLKKRLAMLDLLIDCKRKGQIDDDGIAEEVDTFMFEGHDTTSMGLSFALMLLANHEDVQERIYKECLAIFGGDNRRASYEDLQAMEYTGRVIKECTRLYPSVPLISRTLSEDLVLSNGVAPAGSMVNIHIYDLHRNPQVFPDPLKFDPDRFLPENSKGRHPYSHIAFSAGPRNCIGQKFAMLELKSVISAIVRNFVLKKVDGPEDMSCMADIVLRNSKPIYVKFEERVHESDQHSY